MGAEVGLGMDEMDTNLRGTTCGFVQHATAGNTILGNQGDDFLLAAAELIIGDDRPVHIHRRVWSIFAGQSSLPKSGFVTPIDTYFAVGECSPGVT
jgi:hypothetical protein